MPKYIGTISMEMWNEDAIIRVYENLDGKELYLGRETGRNGFKHYQYCMHCAGDLVQYNESNNLGWHIELCVSWEESKNYCRKGGNYLYLGDSIEERTYAYIRSRPTLPIWKAFATNLARQNDRGIDVWVDTDGKSGKSTWCYLLERRGKVLTIPRTEKSPKLILDFVAAHYNNEPVIAVDIPRSETLDIATCNVLETLKDGTINSAKYQGKKMFIKGVRIIVFTNHFIPNDSKDPKKDVYGKLTKDRWNVYSVQAWRRSRQGNTTTPPIHSIGEE